jgi:hypothetical protein
VSTETESPAGSRPGPGASAPKREEPRNGDGSRPARPKRSEGQWALGDRTALNPNEEWKAK